jgi:threonine dehydrogenase-like Zn-dependent dehydrogenase
MTLPWDALYSGQLAIYGTRGMPAHRYPALLDFIAATGLDLSPMIARRVGLSDASAELALFDGPAPPGRRRHHRFRLVRGQGASPS